VILLLFGGFDVLDPDRAQAVGMDGSLRRPLTRDAILGVLEQRLGPLPAEEPTPLEIPEDTPPIRSVSPLAVPVVEPNRRPPLVAQERAATFIPADYDAIPQVRVDPEVVSVAMERAILAALPEAVEVVLEKSLSDSSSMRSLIAGAVASAVREQLPAIVRSVMSERPAGDPVPRSRR